MDATEATILQEAARVYVEALRTEHRAAVRTERALLTPDPGAFAAYEEARQRSALALARYERTCQAVRGPTPS